VITGDDATTGPAIASDADYAYASLCPTSPPPVF